MPMHVISHFIFMIFNLSKLKIKDKFWGVQYTAGYVWKTSKSNKSVAQVTYPT